jgi:hypothetical protein
MGKFQGNRWFGPAAHAESFLIENSEDRQLIMRDVYERINALLDKLDIEPFQEKEV